MVNALSPGGAYSSTMDEATGRGPMGSTGMPLSGSQSLPQSPRGQLRSQRSLDGALGGSSGRGKRALNILLFYKRCPGVFPTILFNFYFQELT